MAGAKFRVLLDLSTALHGYCGTAQDVRLLYKVLASCPEVDLTGLIYQPYQFGFLHRFCKPHATRGDRLENQARLLWALAERSVAWPQSRGLRLLKMLRHVAVNASASRAKLDLLDVERFGEVIWRLLFNQSLSPDDFSLVQNGRFLLSNLCDGMIHARAFTRRKPIKVDTRGYDFFIVEHARPFRISSETRQIVRHHDMVGLLDPDTRPNQRDIAWQHLTLRRSVGTAFFVCSSEPSRRDLTRIYPQLASRSTTIPCAISEVCRSQTNLDTVRSIIDMRRSTASGECAPKSLGKDFQYVMCVSTLEPRKNFTGLIQAFNLLTPRLLARRQTRDLKLLIVGSPGWKYAPILSAMRGSVASGELVHLEQVSADELRALYTQAAAFVFPSYSEGFGLPPLEAMQCGVPVIASDIPQHRWVMGNAALYCDPYDVKSIAAAIERLVASSESNALRTELIARGREQVKLYSLERCIPQWINLFRCLKERPRDADSRAPYHPANTSLMERAA